MNHKQSNDERLAVRRLEMVLLVLFVVLVAATTFTVDPFGIKQAVLDVLNNAS